MSHFNRNLLLMQLKMTPLRVHQIKENSPPLDADGLYFLVLTLMPVFFKLRSKLDSIMKQNFKKYFFKLHSPHIFCHNNEVLQKNNFCVCVSEAGLKLLIFKCLYLK